MPGLLPPRPRLRRGRQRRTGGRIRSARRVRRAALSGPAVRSSRGGAARDWPAAAQAPLDWARRQGGGALWLTTWDHLPYNCPFDERAGFVAVPEAECAPVSGTTWPRSPPGRPPLTPESPSAGPSESGFASRTCRLHCDRRCVEWRRARRNGRACWGCSSAGRAPESHSGGRRFDPVHLHELTSVFSSASVEKAFQGTIGERLAPSRGSVQEASFPPASTPSTLFCWAPATASRCA